MTITQTTKVQSVLDKTFQLLQEGLVKEGFSFIVDKLNEATKDLPQETIDTEVREECLQHPVAKLILQEPITKWSYQKPRGYSGDAELIDYFYRHKSCDINDSYLGKELNGYVTLASSSSAVRWRSNHVAQEIAKHQAKVGRKISVISIASGHLRELGYISEANTKIDRFVCIDQDKQSNLLKRKLDGQQFDFIYSSGLFDYLNDKIASKMIEILYTNLRPGGQMIIPNFLKGIKEKAYMETFMKWNLIYRNEADMEKLCAGLNLPSTKRELYYDDMKSVVYLKLTK